MGRWVRYGGIKELGGEIKGRCVRYGGIKKLGGEIKGRWSKIRYKI